METGQWFWILLLIVGGGFELSALAQKKSEWTLSWGIWWLRSRTWARPIIIPAWAWMTYHFFLEPENIAPGASVWADDFLLLAISAIAAFFVDYKDIQSNRELAKDHMPRAYKAMRKVERK